jgi:hypothetical protein
MVHYYNGFQMYYQTTHFAKGKVNTIKKGQTIKIDLAPFLVFPHGLEPRLSEPESEVLPLHHRKITYSTQALLLQIYYV